MTQQEEWSRLPSEDQAKIQRAIDREDATCFAVCADTCQMFDNVKHMTWFRLAVGREKGCIV